MKARKLAKKLDRPIDWRIAKKHKEKQQAKIVNRKARQQNSLLESKISKELKQEIVQLENRKARY